MIGNTSYYFHVIRFILHTLAQLKSGQLDSISHLKISEQLTTFPVEIFNLSNSLEVLDLSNNALKSLPDDFNRLKKLKIIFLSNNNFDCLPKVIGKCPELEMIGFKANKIVSVPEDALPVKTRWLILTDNHIEALPESMGKLYRLQKLALAGNKIKQLPHTMQHCTSLELIRISANELSSLPDWLFNLPRLAWLAFSGNPMLTERAFCHSKNDRAEMINVNLEDVQLEALLGEGASGFIHRAKWLNKPEELTTANDYVAVKLFKGNVTSDGYPIDELNNCLQAGEHVNLIKVVAKIIDQEQLALVMELIPERFYNLGLPPSLVSCTRDTFDKKTKINPQTITKIALSLADALRHLHENNVSHGDIYAHNTMIDEHATILFGDFGAASNLLTLPLHQQQAMEAIEMRAFACFIEDLLLINKVKEPCELNLALTVVKDKCMAEMVSTRLTFKNVVEKLTQLQN